MIRLDDLDRALAAYMEGETVAPAPGGLLEAVTTATAGRRPRPTWSARLHEAGLARRAPAVRSAQFTGAAGHPGSRDARRLALLIAATLLIAAAILAMIGAARLLDRPQRVFGEFVPTSPMPPSQLDDRYVNAAARLNDGRVLAVGMYASSGPSDAWAYLYDPANGTWSETGREPFYRTNITATTLQDGRVLIVGGWRVDEEGVAVMPAQGELYNPDTGTFAPTRGGLTSPRYGHTATLLDDGRVLIVGGDGPDFNGAHPLARAEIYDPATDSFSPTGSTSLPRSQHVATRLADGAVLITGGTPGKDSVATTSAEIFEPATGTFRDTGPMAVARSDHAAVALADGRVLVVGGFTAPAGSADVSSTAAAELFDPGTGTFSPTSPLTTERHGAGATVLADGHVLVAGGSNDFGSPRGAELFDPATGRFDPAGSSQGPHGEAWTETVPDGRVLILARIEDPAATGVPELWSGLGGARTAPSRSDPTPGAAFTVLDTDASVLRVGHTATVLADGRVLLAGGSDARTPDAGATSTAEILDPKTGRSTPVGNLTRPRSGHVAVLLADGRVLLAAGEPLVCSPADGSCETPLPTAEIFDPGTGQSSAIGVDLGQPRGSREGIPAAILLAHGRVLFVGAAVGEGRSVSIVDPATATSAAGLSVPCTANVSLVRMPDDRIFMQCDERSPGAYAFDPATGTVSVVPGLVAFDAAVGLRDGRILVVREGGDAAIFDPSTSLYTKTGSTIGRDDPDPSHRYGEPYERRLTLLGDGRVLVSGGRSVIDKVPALATAEIYDPLTGTFASVGPMHAARYRHTATLLADGRALLVGGVTRSPDRTDPEPATAEIFDPASSP